MSRCYKCERGNLHPFHDNGQPNAQWDAGRKPHPSHRFAADADGDNSECFYCMCRPYNNDASHPCPYEPQYRRPPDGP